VVPPFLHFGYFDLDAIRRGEFQKRDVLDESRLMDAFHEIFDNFPGNEMPGLGFFDYYGLLTCVCPSVFSTAGFPVQKILEMVGRSACDVVYSYNNEYLLVAPAILPVVLDPERIPRENVGLA
jgi:hypothetical protein